MIVVYHAGHEIELPPDSMIIIKRASERDYESLANEDLKIEFDGECLYIHSPASKLHENVVFNLMAIFKRHVSQSPFLGDIIGSKFALKLPNGKRPEPDVVVVPRGAVADNDSVYEGVPPLVVEVLSTSTKDHDLNIKHTWYEESHVPEIWYVDLEGHKVTVLRLSKDGTYTSTDYAKDVIICEALGRLEIPLADIFTT
ncbi:MAG: Uma2 family endonuclease [Candidatus Sigynarchaeota archaeon]